MTFQLGQAGFGSASTLQDKILAFLGEYGAYIPAYELPELLDRSFGAPVDEGACRASLDELIAKKRVSRSPDQPSMVRIVRKVGPVVLGDQPKSEAEIMPNLGHYLRGDFRTVIAGDAGAFYLVVDTSHKGPATGTWRRPDFTVVNVTDLPLFGRRQVDVHSIELKTETAAPSRPCSRRCRRRERPTTRIWLGTCRRTRLGAPICPRSRPPACCMASASLRCSAEGQKALGTSVSGLSAARAATSTCTDTSSIG